MEVGAIERRRTPREGVVGVGLLAAFAVAISASFTSYSSVNRVVCAATVVLAALARAYRERSRSMQPWLWLAACFACTATAYFLGGARDSTETIAASVLVSASYGFGLIFLIQVTRGRQPVESVGPVIDAIAIALAVGTAAYLAAGQRATELLHQNWFRLIWPLFDISLFAYIVVFLSRARWKSERLLIFLALAGGFLALGDLATLANLGSEIGNACLISGLWLMCLATFAATPDNSAFEVRKTPTGNVSIVAVVISLVTAAVFLNCHDTVSISLGASSVGIAMLRLSFLLHRMRAFDLLRSEARTDDLTGLPNRRALRERLDSVVDGRVPHAVLLIDLDAFKEINDTLGHEAGDDLLKSTARRLQSVLSDRRIHLALYRLGGDEFACVFEARHAAEEVGELMRTASLVPQMLHGVRVMQDVSIGVATFPTDATDPSGLLRMADRAMYAAKSEKLGVVVATPAMSGKRRDLALQTYIRESVEARNVDLHYQPQTDLSTGRIIGVEALLRLQFEGSLISPTAVLEVCEQFGLLPALTDGVLRKASHTANNWRMQGRELSMSINVSGRDIESGTLAERVERQLRAYALPPASLCLEITEESLFGRRAEVLRSLQDLRDLGVRLSMDDFGVGFSSLSNLRTLVVDEIKLDRSFISCLDLGSRTASLVETVVSMARRLDATVVAEGVETMDELHAIRRLGVDVGQGYFLGRPQALADVEPSLDRVEQNWFADAEEHALLLSSSDREIRP